MTRPMDPLSGAAVGSSGPADVGVACRALVKDYGEHRVLKDLTFQAPMGAVTGFVGVNGAGKTTTLRIVLGLVKATSGEALIAGERYRDLRSPRHVVGAVLDGPGAHPGQSGRAYLEILARAAGIGGRRITEVLETVDLTEAARRRVGGYSLGMRQRLALAGALLGDPAILVLDEPANGLDPIGIRWIREFLRKLAAEGRCVLVSSHQLGELEATADRVVMIDNGKLIADEDIGGTASHQAREVEVRTPEPERLTMLVVEAGGSAEPGGDRGLVVRGLTAERIGEIAAAAGVVLHSLTERGGGLEEMFLDLSNAAQANATERGGR